MAVRRKQVLLVEDDEAVLGLLCDEIKDCGHAADCVNTLSGALDRLHPHSHTLAICDELLPDGSGRELVKLAESYEIKTILMTGDPDVASELAFAGIPCLQKPFSLALLREVLQQHLR